MKRKQNSVRAVLLLVFGLVMAAPASSREDGGSFYRGRLLEGAFSGGDLNISSFVFRDRNRNGVFDLGDRAMAHIAVEMIRPDGSRWVERSNVAGFANFEMSVLRREADIREEGVYEFSAKVPPGWILTTGNAVQARSFRVLPGAPADLISLQLAEPMGFAPVLTISGWLATSPGLWPSTLTAISPAGEAKPMLVDADGAYTLAATPGVWTLEIKTEPGATIRRSVEVGETPVVVSAVDVTLSAPDPAPARSIATFEDLIGTQGVAEIPSGIGGVKWRNWVAAHNRNYDGEGYVNGTISGEFVAYNSSGHPAEITSEVPFDFIGGYFGIAWMRAEGERLQVTGWRGDDVAYQDRIELSSLGPVYFAADYRGVTRIQFSTEHYWQFIADDLSFGLRH